MRWLERLEKRLHWLAIPGLFKFLALFGVVIFACQLVNPAIAALLVFDKAAVLGGEYWRIITWALSPQGYFPVDMLGVIFLYFAVMIAFLVSDSLEQIWSPTRLTLYILLGWLGLTGVQFLLGGFPSAGTFLYAAVFFAFATHFPTIEFRIFFIIPVQVRWIAWLGFGIIAFQALKNPLYVLVVISALLPYALWVLPDFLRNRKNLAKTAIRRREYETKALPEDDAFHRCEACKRTERTDPDLEFRTLLDGTEYCVDHLPPDPAN